MNPQAISGQKAAYANRLFRIPAMGNLDQPSHGSIVGRAVPKLNADTTRGQAACARPPSRAHAILVSNRDCWSDNARYDARPLRPRWPQRTRAAFRQCNRQAAKAPPSRIDIDRRRRGAGPLCAGKRGGRDAKDLQSDFGLLGHSAQNARREGEPFPSPPIESECMRTTPAPGNRAMRKTACSVPAPA